MMSVEENIGDVRVRCFGGPNDPAMMKYHDDEWGVPVHDDRKLFESLVLDGFQAGLSWRTILNKRDAFRRAFDGFDAKLIARYGTDDVDRLLADAGIVRNRLKIAAAIGNAQLFLDIQHEFGSFDRYIWGFTGHKTLRNPGVITIETMLASTAQSDEMSADLRSRGFKFVGATICYAFMQAVGMVDDHIDECWKLAE
jgi:DNA-3-methyladenine glycosylase I